jgi:hypothetical protein
LRYYDEPVTDKIAKAVIASGWLMSRKWKISRRTMLPGAAASVSLPLLEVMARGAGSRPAPTRLVSLFQPNGVYPKAWDVTGVGKDFQWSPILEPLAPFREDVLVISNLGTPARGHVAATNRLVDRILEDSRRLMRQVSSADKREPPVNTPLANLHLTLAQRMGIETARFNTSTGVLADL